MPFGRREFHYFLQHFPDPRYELIKNSCFFAVSLAIKTPLHSGFCVSVSNPRDASCALNFVRTASVFLFNKHEKIYADPKYLLRCRQIFESIGFKKATCPTKMKIGFKTASFATAKHCQLPKKERIMSQQRFSGASS